MKTRYSKQRELIYNHLKSRCDHPTAETIYADLKLSNPELSLGTVYRNLNFLAESKMIKKFDAGKQIIHFDADLLPHYHFICSKCHEVYDIYSDVSAHVHQEVQKGTKHQIEFTNISFTGICENCLKKEN